MPDREKVIKGLEMCLAADLTEDENPCAPCPYFFDGMCQNSIKADALALLKEQEGVEPYRDEEWPNGEYACGCCAQALFDKGKLARPRFCPWCGRKVNWDADGT